MLDSVLLFPYWLSLKIRHFLFDKGIRKVSRAEVPTICVGNVTVGGTGKTPHTEMILRLLSQMPQFDGKNFAVLSRGYKRKTKGFQQVTSDGSAAAFGDEPLQMKKKFPYVTVAVDSDRVEGCEVLRHPDLLEGKPKKRSLRKCADRDFPAADLIVLDDAFQYRPLKADLTVLLVDWSRPVYKDHLLPLGSLRDLPGRVSEADVIIVTKCPHDLDPWQKTTFAYTLGLRDFATSTCSGTNPKGKTQKVFFTTVDNEPMRPVFEETDCRYIYSKRLVLFTGIAKDTALRRYLGDSYRLVGRFSFPDHHRFRGADFRKIRRVVSKYPTAAVATTEKDAQRVLDSRKVPGILRERMFSLPIKVSFLSEAEEQYFRDELEKLVK